MANTVKWSTLGTYTTLIDGAASAPTLKNLASAARVLGSEVNNEAGNQYCEIELKVRGAVAFGATAYMALYFVIAADSTNYEDGDASTTPARPPDVIIPVRAISTQQRITLRNIVLPNAKFKPLFINNGGQALTNTDGENVLYYRAYNDLIT